jgi:hypothetical protein
VYHESFVRYSGNCVPVAHSKAPSRCTPDSNHSLRQSEPTYTHTPVYILQPTVQAIPSSSTCNSIHGLSVYECARHSSSSSSLAVPCMSLCPKEVEAAPPNEATECNTIAPQVFCHHLHTPHTTHHTPHTTHQSAPGSNPPGSTQCWCLRVQVQGGGMRSEGSWWRVEGRRVKGLPGKGVEPDSLVTVC